MSEDALYVIGLAFTRDDRVALIRKDRPDWMAGKLNGVGGKIEIGEEPVEAMCREFFEETGVNTVPDQWMWIGGISDEGFNAKVFYMRSDTVEQVKTMTSEEVGLYHMGTMHIWVDDVMADLVDAMVLCRALK